MGNASSEGDAHEHVTNPSEPPPPPPRPPPDGWVFSEQMHMPLQYYSEDTALEVAGPKGGSTRFQFDHVFWMGDLNYRLGAAELPDKVSASRPDSVAYWQDVASDIVDCNWQALYERDQLREHLFVHLHTFDRPSSPQPMPTTVDAPPYR